MTILILGNEDEAHAAFIHQKIRCRGRDAEFFDTRCFPSQTLISYFPGDHEAGFFQAHPSARRIPLGEIRAVYWRYFMGVDTENLTDPFLQQMAFREIHSALGSLFRNLQARWVNTPIAVDMHTYKGYQLQLMQAAGIRIPATLVSNDAAVIRDFYEKMDGKLIFKPVMGGAHTEVMSDADFAPERMKELEKSPVQFQEFVPGVDIRVYLVGDHLFAAEIQSKTVDFRNDPEAPIVPITLPEQVQKDCRTVAETLGLLMTGIDVRRTPDGEYVFLEGNPSPMFIHFESVTGYPISDRLVDLLLEA